MKGSACSQAQRCRDVPTGLPPRPAATLTGTSDRLRVCYQQQLAWRPFSSSAPPMRGSVQQGHRATVVAAAATVTRTSTVAIGSVEVGQLISGSDENGRRVWLEVVFVPGTGFGDVFEAHTADGWAVRVQIDGYSATLTRIGFAVDPDAHWMQEFPGWQPMLRQAQEAAAPQLQGDAATSVLHDLNAEGSFEGLLAAVAADPSMWCAGTGKDASALTEAETMTLNAGELIALMEGQRGAAMVQLWVGWDPVAPQPSMRPFVLRLLRAAALDPRVAVHMSAVPGSPDLGLTSILVADKSPWMEWGAHLASFGAQAAIVAQSPYYKLLIGRVLGYDADNIRAHIQEGGAVLEPMVAKMVEQQLAQLSTAPAALPWWDRGPREQRPADTRGPGEQSRAAPVEAEEVAANEQEAGRGSAAVASARPVAGKGSEAAGSERVVRVPRGGGGRDEQEDGAPTVGAAAVADTAVGGAKGEGVVEGAVASARAGADALKAVGGKEQEVAGGSRAGGDAGGKGTAVVGAAVGGVQRARGEAGKDSEARAKQSAAAAASKSEEGEVSGKMAAGKEVKNAVASTSVVEIEGADGAAVGTSAESGKAGLKTTKGVAASTSEEVGDLESKGAKGATAGMSEQAGKQAESKDVKNMDASTSSKGEVEAAKGVAASTSDDADLQEAGKGERGVGTTSGGAVESTLDKIAGLKAGRARETKAERVVEGKEEDDNDDEA